MNEKEDFDAFVESLPTMLILLGESVSEDRAPATQAVQELRATLGAALAAAERLRLERRRSARRSQAKGPSRTLHLVT
jgi:hypothetical protein